jgi:diacylglycerol kinase (ATP)
VKPPPRTWLGKFYDAFRGLYVAVWTQSSFTPHLLTALLAIGVAAWLGVSATEWCMVTLGIGLVLMAEVFNTSIEAMAKTFNRYPDDNLRDALDIASGGVFMAVLTAVVLGVIVFGPKLWALAIPN